MRKRSLVVVEWDDIAAYSSWRKETEAGDVKPMRCVSVGWRIPSKDRKQIIIAAGRNDIKECTDRVVIPKGVIHSIRRIE